tara:strand:+ start:22 stop:594 length:573 start_codon:yes stop_codon:yes gene_type:complete
MKKLKLSVPNNWKDVTIQQYQKFMELVESDKSDQKKMIGGVSIFCNITTKETKQIGLKDLKHIYGIIIKMIDTEHTEQQIEKNIMFNKRKYAMIPNLSDMTTGEFIDLETYCEDDMMKNLHKVMAILYRPIVDDVDRFKRYTIEPYAPTPENDELFLSFPMTNVLGVLSFFFHLGEPLSRDFHKYLVKQK